MSDDRPDVEQVQQKLDEIQRRKRGGVRWKMSRNTMERAIEAIGAADPASPQLPRPNTSKSRRRKRRKRLL
jgi:hypothetical protein